MIRSDQSTRPSASIELRTTATGDSVALTGPWNLRGLVSAGPTLQEHLSRIKAQSNIEWDLTGIRQLDSAGAALLWRVWGHTRPARLLMRQDQRSTFERLEKPGIPTTTDLGRRAASPWFDRVHNASALLTEHAVSFIAILGQFVLDVAHLLRRPSDTPFKEISATIYETGGRALGITALVGFLIGVVVSYLSSFQLQTFGAQIYIVNILGLSIIRELGPLLAAILVAGRSGSAMTAGIGVMRVTQELDALEAMGISASLRLILPKVAALSIALPLLVVWTDVVALAGGATSAQLELDIGFHQFLTKLPEAVPVANFAIGLGKGAVFGLFIALIACHFGNRIKPNTESIGHETTNSVVASITLVILVDAVFAIVFRGVGMP